MQPAMLNSAIHAILGYRFAGEPRRVCNLGAGSAPLFDDSLQRCKPSCLESWGLGRPKPATSAFL
eukprot:1726362-Alexandrium_andersonii.AAC.1